MAVVALTSNGKIHQLVTASSLNSLSSVVAGPDAQPTWLLGCGAAPSASAAAHRDERWRQRAGWLRSAPRVQGCGVRVQTREQILVQ
jgi:hypothetical protein